MFCLRCYSRMRLKKAFLFLLVFALCFSALSMFALAQNQSLDYILSFQEAGSGGVREEYYDEPQDLQTDWAIMAFVTAGYNPSSVGSPKSLIDFSSTDLCSIESVTDIERKILTLSASNLDPEVASVCDLTEKLKLSYDASSGMIGPNLVSTVFGALALSSAGETVSGQTVEYIIDNQDEDGGWDSGWGSESNFTAQTIMALVASGLSNDTPVLEKAKQYLKGLQTSSGGIKYDYNEWSTEPDAFSDSFTLQAIYALGENPLDDYWLSGGKSIVDDLSSLLQNDGSFAYSAGYGKMTPVWTTSIATIALNKSYLPMKKESLRAWPTSTVTASLSITPQESVSPEQSLAVPVTILQTATSTPIETVAQNTTISIGSSRKRDIHLENSILPSSIEPSPTFSTATNSDVNLSEDQSKVLGVSVQNRAFDFRWIALILSLSFSAGLFIKYLELKYVKN